MKILDRLGFSKPAPGSKGPGKPIVLMHIAKTAGTTARTALMQVFSDVPTRSLIDPAQLAAAWRADPWELAGCRLLAGHFGTDFINRLPFPIFRTAFVRDPVERCLSHYVFTRELDLARVNPVLAARLDKTRNEPLEKLLQSDDPFIVAQYRDHQVRQFAGRTHLEPEGDLPNDGEDLLQQAMEQASLFDVIGLQEAFAESMELLFREARLGAVPETVHSWINASNATEENSALRRDESLRAKIADCNEADILFHLSLQKRNAEALEAMIDGED